MRVVVAAVLIAIPIVLLAAAVVSWFQVGLDLPIADDWRAYLDRRVGSLDLAYLFTPRNDTLYPVGQVLDGIAHFVLAGNSVIYQALTMTWSWARCWPCNGSSCVWPSRTCCTRRYPSASAP